MGLFTKKAPPKRSANHREDKDYIQQRKNILSKSSDFYTREAYKSLRTNIIFSTPTEGCRKICITSALSGEGKSITTLNLAISFAEAGQRVLLIDADMRRPKQAKLLSMKASPGLSNVLANLCAIEDVVNSEVYRHLDVIFSGDIPPNPSELLGHNRMKQLLTQLGEQYDYIFIDTPPVNVVTDACVLSPLLDGVLMVVRQGHSDRDSIQYAMSQLEFTEAKVLGFILNGANLGSANRYGYGKYKKYKRYGKYGYRYGYNYGYGYGYGYQERERENRQPPAPPAPPAGGQ